MKHIRMNSLDNLKTLFNSLQVKEGEPCSYCGILSTDKEHVIPISWIKSMNEMRRMGFNVAVPKVIIVPACRECNLIASDTLFKNFREKRQYIAEKLLKKYKKFIKFKLWEEKEILELSGALREHTFYFNEVAKIIKKRLKTITKYLR